MRRPQSKKNARARCCQRAARRQAKSLSRRARASSLQDGRRRRRLILQVFAAAAAPNLQQTRAPMKTNLALVASRQQKHLSKRRSRRAQFAYERRARARAKLRSCLAALVRAEWKPFGLAKAKRAACRSLIDENLLTRNGGALKLRESWREQFATLNCFASSCAFCLLLLQFVSTSLNYLVNKR